MLSAMWLETDRLRLRRWHEGETAALARLADASHSGVDASEWFRRDEQCWDTHGFGSLAVTLRSDDDPIADVALLIPEALPDRAPAPGERATEVEVRWRVAPEHRNQGYATEAATAWLDWAFQMLGIDRALGIAPPADLASMRVMDKLGMHAVGPLTHPLTGVKVLVRTVTRDGWRERSRNIEEELL